MAKRRSGTQNYSSGIDNGPSSGDRREEKRRRFEDKPSGKSRSFKPGFFITVGAVVAVAVFVLTSSFANKAGPAAVAASTLQQVPAATAAREGGKVSILAQEVTEKKLVAWDYKEGSKTVPLLAYTTPSGALKLASRMCEPCNSTSFHVEGTQLVCNSCGSRWELENSKGVSGGCLTYPPEVFPSSVVDGKLSVDEQAVAKWVRRV